MPDFAGRLWLSGPLFEEKLREAAILLRDAQEMLREPGALHPASITSNTFRLETARMEVAKALSALAGPIERARGIRPDPKPNQER